MRALNNGKQKENYLMRLTKALQLGLCAAALSAVLTTSALADEHNQKTIVTFNDSVRIPGQVLAPGTYVFMLLNSTADRSLVEVWNADQRQLLATVKTSPTILWNNAAYPGDQPDHAYFQLDEQPDGNMVLRSFYFPGTPGPQQFLYFSHSPR
jgi:hypothetical protein